MGKCIRKLLRIIAGNDLIFLAVIVFYIFGFYTIFVPNGKEGAIAYPTTFAGILWLMLLICKMFEVLQADVINKLSKLICILIMIVLLCHLGVFWCMASWNFLHSIIVIYVLLSFLINKMFLLRNGQIKLMFVIKKIGSRIDRSYEWSMIFIFCMSLGYIFYLDELNKCNVMQQSILYILPFTYLFAIKYIFVFGFSKSEKDIIVGLHFSLLLFSMAAIIFTKLCIYQICRYRYEWIARYNSDTMITFILIFLTLFFFLIKTPSHIDKLDIYRLKR